MADRELDREVAERVLGHPVEAYFERGVDYFETRKPTEREFARDTHYGAKDPNKVSGYPLRHYSSDIGAAMTIFEAMVEQTGCGSIAADMEDARGQGFIVSVSFGMEDEGGSAVGPLPEAICRAALAATGSADRAGREVEA